jgi:hypothetical protein
MATVFQVTFDCAEPGRMTRFWASVLGYEVEKPPAGFATWTDYWRGIGVPEDELGDGDHSDSIVDPAGAGPRIWFQQVPERKQIKNRLHLDVKVSGGRSVPIETRRQRVDAEAERLVGLGATIVRVLFQEGLDHYAVALQDPEGNEFDLN